MKNNDFSMMFFHASKILTITASHRKFIIRRYVDSLLGHVCDLLDEERNEFCVKLIQSPILFLHVAENNGA